MRLLPALFLAAATLSGCAPLLTTAASTPAGQAAVGDALDAALVRAGLRPAALTAPLGAARVAADTLAAGPMLADVTMREATVWVQTTAPALVRLVVEAAPAAGQAASGSFARADTTRPVLSGADGIATVRLAGLEPGTTYRYRVLVDGRPVALPYATSVTTQPLWQWRTDPPEATIAFGSCFYDNDRFARPGRPYGADPAIFERIADLRPDAMLWIGDNLYLRESDWWSPEGIAYRYANARQTPQMQRLLASTVHYATWDDHDYGPNDSDRSYVHKEAALETFRRYWPNPTHGIPGTPGAITNFQIADVEVFVLDNRTYRAPNRAPADERTILGEAQIAWLLDALTFSDAPFKLIAMGGQFVNPVAVFENYVTIAPAERQRILDEIARRRIDGVVFLSGDRHHGELQRLERPGTYPLYDFTSSPLTAGASTYPTRDDSPERDSPTRVPGTLLAGQHNFGTLTVSGPRTDRTLTMRAYLADGSLAWQQAVRAADLRSPRE